MTDEDDILAAEYVLGLTDPAEIAGVESRLAADGDFRAVVTAWEARLLAQAPEEAAPPAAPPAALWERIDAMLDASAAAPATRTIHPDQGVWEPWFRGVERKVLHVDAGGERVTYLVRMKAGAVLPRHRHEAHEHCIVLEGELAIGDMVFGTGAYQFAQEGVPHARITARTDALFFIHGAA